jgi:CheY-like chemotaxis protein
MVPTASSLRVLLVDDEPGVRSYMKVILQKHGCAVVEAVDGADAYRVMQEQNGNFDLLLTDIRMPRMDGLSLAGRVHDTFPAVPILFVSAYPLDAPSFRASNFLAKPFLPKALITRVQELSNRS